MALGVAAGSFRIHLISCVIVWSKILMFGIENGVVQKVYSMSSWMTLLTM